MARASQGVLEAKAGDGFDPRFGKIPCRREWLPTPVFLPGESKGQRSLVGYSPRGRQESETTKQQKQSSWPKRKTPHCLSLQHLITLSITSSIVFALHYWLIFLVTIVITVRETKHQITEHFPSHMQILKWRYPGTVVGGEYRYKTYLWVCESFQPKEVQ